ncbi:MAG: hypothetical protein WA405_08555 [Candidatus Acidiferrales bacterium]
MAHYDIARVLVNAAADNQVPGGKAFLCERRATSDRNDEQNYNKLPRKHTRSVVLFKLSHFEAPFFDFGRTPDASGAMLWDCEGAVNLAKKGAPLALP